MQKPSEAIAAHMFFVWTRGVWCSGVTCYDFNLASLADSILAISKTGTMSAVPAGMMGQSPMRICVVSFERR